MSLDELAREVAQLTDTNFPKNPTFEDSVGSQYNSTEERRKAAIELLALGTNYSAVAKAVGVDRRTVFTWRQQEDFREAVRQRHRELWSDPAERLRMLADPAVEVLAEHLNDAYDRSRFRAATAILKLIKLGNNEPKGL